MRFIHITDTHVAADRQFTHYGHAPLANLAALVDTLNSLALTVDFVLHTGDVVEDKSELAYRLARSELSRLAYPVRYLAGNHDDAALLQRVLLDRTQPEERLDYRFEAGGVEVAVFDSRGPNDPEGTLTDGQLAALRALCTPSGPPLVIAIHHPPVPLDTIWLDRGWAVERGRTRSMLLDRRQEFVQSVAPARERLRGVFFGHVHRAFQVVHRGILYASAPSAFGQLLSWPDQEQPEPSPGEPAGFSVVTITPEQTVIRQHVLERPGPRASS
jgi:3',5'-cyclic-AMP phosphodiesterase